MAYLIQTTLKPHFWWLYPPFPWYSTDYPYETGSFFLPKIAAELPNKKPWLVEPSMTTTIDSPWLVRKQSFQVARPFPLKILSYMISYIPRFCWSFMVYIPPKWLVSFEKKHTKSCAPDDYSYVCSEKIPKDWHHLCQVLMFHFWSQSPSVLLGGSQVPIQWLIPSTG